MRKVSELLIDSICSLIYAGYMQYIGRCHNFVFLPVASNDNDDLLSLNSPFCDLSLIRDIKQHILDENRLTGMLLSSRKERKFFQEVSDAERYVVMCCFSAGANKETIRALKRHIITNYLHPKPKRRRKG